MYSNPETSQAAAVMCCTVTNVIFTYLVLLRFGGCIKSCATVLMLCVE